MSDELLCTCAHVSKSAFTSLLTSMPLACNDVKMEIVLIGQLYHREYDRQSIAWTNFDKTHALLMTCKFNEQHLEFMSNRRTLLTEVKPTSKASDAINTIIFDDDETATTTPVSQGIIPDWLATIEL